MTLARTDCVLFSGEYRNVSKALDCYDTVQLLIQGDLMDLTHQSVDLAVIRALAQRNAMSCHRLLFDYSRIADEEEEVCVRTYPRDSLIY